MVSFYPEKFGDHMHYGIENVMLLNCHMILT